MTHWQDAPQGSEELRWFGQPLADPRDTNRLRSGAAMRTWHGGPDPSERDLDEATTVMDCCDEHTDCSHTDRC